MVLSCVIMIMGGIVMCDCHVMFDNDHGWMIVMCDNDHGWIVMFDNDHVSWM